MVTKIISSGTEKHLVKTYWINKCNSVPQGRSRVNVLCTVYASYIHRPWHAPNTVFKKLKILSGETKGADKTWHRNSTSTDVALKWWNCFPFKNTFGLKHFSLTGHDHIVSIQPERIKSHLRGSNKKKKLKSNSVQLCWAYRFPYQTV